MVIFAIVAIVDSLLSYGCASEHHPAWCGAALWSAIFYASFAALFASVALVFGRLSRWFYAAWFVFAVSYFAVVSFLKFGFGLRLDADIVQTVVATNWHEAALFARGIMYSRWALAILGFAVVVTFGVRLILLMEYPRVRLRGIMFAAAALGVFVLCNAVAVSPLRSAGRIGYAYITALTVRHYGQFAAIYAGMMNPDLPEKIASRNPAPMGVVFIGESVTRNRMGLYDKSLLTTPNLCRMPTESVFVFTDVVTANPGTLGATRYMLTDAELNGGDVRGITMPEVFKRAGYYVSYITSNSYDNPNGMYGIIFHGCSSIIQPEAGDDGVSSSFKGTVDNVRNYAGGG